MGETRHCFVYQRRFFPYPILVSSFSWTIQEEHQSFKCHWMHQCFHTCFSPSMLKLNFDYFCNRWLMWFPSECDEKHTHTNRSSGRSSAVVVISVIISNQHFHIDVPKIYSRSTLHSSMNRYETLSYNNLLFLIFVKRLFRRIN